MYRGYVVICLRIAVLRTKKELPVLECILRGRVYLISHPYNDSSAPYLSTAILTILYFRHLFAITLEQEYTLNRPPPCETDTNVQINAQVLYPLIIKQSVYLILKIGLQVVGLIRYWVRMQSDISQILIVLGQIQTDINQILIVLYLIQTDIGRILIVLGQIQTDPIQEQKEVE